MHIGALGGEGVLATKNWSEKIVFRSKLSIVRAWGAYRHRKPIFVIFSRKRKVYTILTINRNTNNKWGTFGLGLAADKTKQKVSKSLSSLFPNYGL